MTNTPVCEVDGRTLTQDETIRSLHQHGLLLCDDCLLDGTAPPRYLWTGWEAEADNDNDDDRKDVYYLMITDAGEEMAIIVHRTCGGKYPLDGSVALAKMARADWIVAALNAAVTGARQ